MVRAICQEDLFITIKTRYRAAVMGLYATIALALLKLVAAFVSHSVGVLSEALHSMLDLVASMMTFFTVRAAAKPADDEHPFGHGKIETLSSLFEALLLTGAAGLIFFEAVDHCRFPVPIDHSLFSMGVMLISMGMSYALYRHHQKAALFTESIALRVNSLHFLSDVLSSGGILMGLILMEWTGWYLIDPLIAFIVAAYILMVSFRQVKGAISELSDTRLPAHERDLILSTVAEFKEKMIEVHELRTRKSGSNRHIDFHLVVCGQLSVEASHAVCDELEAKMFQVFPGSSVHIHVEPCEKEKTQCIKTCPVVQRKDLCGSPGLARL